VDTGSREENASKKRSEPGSDLIRTDKALVPRSPLFKQLLAQQIILRGCVRGLSIVMQVLDGPPGFIARRLSSFLLIPVGIAGRDLHFGMCVGGG
jgi:hypothetical protein